MMTSRSRRSSFRPDMDYLDRRDVPSGIVFIDPGPLLCDLGNTVSRPNTIADLGPPAGTSWPSPLVVTGPLTTN